MKYFLIGEGRADKTIKYAPIKRISTSIYLMINDRASPLKERRNDLPRRKITKHKTATIIIFSE